MARIALFMLIASVTGLFVPVKALAGSSERVDKKLLDRLFEWALKNGDDFRFDKGRAKLLGIEPGAPTKVKDFHLNEIMDDDGHSCYAVLKPGKKPTPFCYVFHAGHSEGDDSTVYYFKLSADGVVEDKVMVSHSKYHDGKPVHGSGRAEWTTLHAPGIYEKFQHEMDVWLKGMYRRHAKETNASGASDATPASAADVVKDAPAATK